MDTYTIFEMSWGGDKKWKDNFLVALIMKDIRSTISLGPIIVMKFKPFILINTIRFKICEEDFVGINHATTQLANRGFIVSKIDSNCSTGNENQRGS